MYASPKGELAVGYGWTHVTGSGEINAKKKINKKSKSKRSVGSPCGMWKETL